MKNAEEYTKISTPRQEVLFKKGSIGKKRPSAATSATSGPATSASASGLVVVAAEDSLNGNSPSSPTSPTGDVDFSFHYSGEFRQLKASLDPFFKGIPLT